MNIRNVCLESADLTALKVDADTTEDDRHHVRIGTDGAYAFLTLDEISRIASAWHELEFAVAERVLGPGMWRA